MISWVGWPARQPAERALAIHLFYLSCCITLLINLVLNFANYLAVMILDFRMTLLLTRGSFVLRAVEQIRQQIVHCRWIKRVQVNALCAVNKSQKDRTGSIVEIGSYRKYHFTAHFKAETYLHNVGLISRKE